MVAVVPLRASGHGGGRGLIAHMVPVSAVWGCGRVGGGGGAGIARRQGAERIRAGGDAGQSRSTLVSSGVIIIASEVKQSSACRALGACRRIRVSCGFGRDCREAPRTVTCGAIAGLPRSLRSLATTGRSSRVRRPVCDRREPAGDFAMVTPGCRLLPSAKAGLRVVRMRGERAGECVKVAWCWFGVE